jgi:DNA-binding SARP family transcriptional activator
MSQHTELTPDVLERIVAAALSKGDMEAVEHAMRLLAVRDPHRADVVLETMKLGLALRERSR